MIRALGAQNECRRVQLSCFRHLLLLHFCVQFLLCYGRVVFFSIAAKYIDVPGCEEARTGMVAAFIQPHFYHCPLVTRNIKLFHSALAFYKIVTTTCIQVSPPADDVYLAVVFNTIREVGSLQIHIGPASESFTFNLKFPILP